MENTRANRATIGPKIEPVNRESNANSMQSLSKSRSSGRQTYKMQVITKIVIEIAIRPIGLSFMVTIPPFQVFLRRCRNKHHCSHNWGIPFAKRLTQFHFETCITITANANMIAITNSRFFSPRCSSVMTKFLPDKEAKNSKSDTTPITKLNKFHETFITTSRNLVFSQCKQRV